VQGSCKCHSYESYLSSTVALTLSLLRLHLHLHHHLHLPFVTTLQWTVVHQWMPLLSYKIFDDNVDVRKRALTVANNVWRTALTQLSRSSTNGKETYEALSTIQDHVLTLVGSSNDGEAIVAIKLCETIAICYSHPSDTVRKLLSMVYYWQHLVTKFSNKHTCNLLGHVQLQVQREPEEVVPVGATPCRTL
jgi:hypothetical protein